MTRQCFDEFHRLFGIRYPFGDYHQAFVPEFNAGAMENPGLVTFRDQMIFRSRPSEAEVLGRTNTIVHEMGHLLGIGTTWGSLLVGSGTSARRSAPVEGPLAR